MDKVVALAHEVKSSCLAGNYGIAGGAFAKLAKVSGYSVPLAQPETGPANQLWRGRLCNGETPYDNLHSCIYPPAEETRLNRANLPKAPVLYASGNRGTMLSEVPHTPGTRIQVIGICPRSRLNAAIIGDIQRLRFSGNLLLSAQDGFADFRTMYAALSEPEKERMAFVDSFLADHFRAPSEKYYALTAFVADRLCKQADCLLVYPSVKAGAGLNFAIPADLFDRSFLVFVTKVLHIKKAYGHGEFELEIERASCAFDADGTIQWKKGDISSLQGGILWGRKAPAGPETD